MDNDLLQPEVMEVVEVELPEVRLSAKIPHSITPIASNPGPGFTKDARGLVPKSADMDPIYVEFVDGLCTSGELKSALAHLGTDKSIKFLGELLQLERKRGTGAKTIVAAAKKCGIGMDTLAEMWRSHSTALAMMKLVSAAPKLAGDVIEAASNHTVVCPACQGAGLLEIRLPTPHTKQCPQCSGTGATMRPGDKDARAHALEWAGMINQPGKSGSSSTGPSVYLNLVLPRKES